MITTFLTWAQSVGWFNLIVLGLVIAAWVYFSVLLIRTT